MLPVPRTWIAAAVLAVPLALATAVAAAQPGPDARMTWSVAEGGEEDMKLGLSVPDYNNYAGLWMSCRRKSGTIMLYIHLQKKNLPAVAELVKRNRGLEVTLTAGKEETPAYPGLGYDQHDETWQLEIRLDLADPLVTALSETGRIELKGRAGARTFQGLGIGEAWPNFAGACRP